MRVTGVFWNARERRLRALWRLVLQALLVVAFSTGVFALLMSRVNIEGLAGFENPVVIVVSNLVLIGAVLVGATFIDRRRFADFGLGVTPVWLMDLLAGILLAAVSLLIMFVAVIAMGWVSTRPDPGVVPFQIVLWFVAFGFVGVGEEMLARGYQLRNLAEGLHGRRLSARGSVVWAAVLSSVFFGLLHVPNPNMTVLAAFNLCVAGLVLALPVVLTGRLGFSIGFHIAWNFVLGNVLGFPVSGLAMEHTVFQVQVSGPDWITGGDFGPEGGAIGLATDAVSVVLILAYARATEGRLRIASDWATYDPPGWRRMPQPLPRPDVETDLREMEEDR